MSTSKLTGLSYHRITAHKRNRLDGAVLDWSNQPDVFKHYADAVHIPLCPVATPVRDCLWSLVSGQNHETGCCKKDLEALSDVLLMGNGITFERVQGGALYSFRSAASAGALYPVEMYVDARQVKGLDPGLYHVDIRNASLAGLKKRAVSEKSDSGPWAVVYLTGMFFRSAWKYRKRAYRYILNDLGHVLANLLVGARAYGCRPDLSCDFSDKALNCYLGLDPSREVALARVELWDSSCGSATHGGTLLTGVGNESPGWTARPAAAREIVYPEIRDVHEAGSEPMETKAAPEDGPGMTDRVSQWQSIPQGSGNLNKEDVATAISKRRSRRNFVSRSLLREQALALVDLVANAWRMIGQLKGVDSNLVPGFLCGDDSGLEPGFYLIDAPGNRFGLVEDGLLTPSMAAACLDQMWLRAAALQFLMIGDLKAVDETLGPRGYRHLMIDAGMIGQLIYLGSTALGLGCCGIGAFYDDETAHILDLHPHEHLLYLVAAGHVKSGCSIM